MLKEIKERAMRKGIFVSGTDTEIGKSFVTASLAGILAKKGIDVGVFKPMMSGAKREDILSDAYILKQFSQDPLPLEKINPFQFDEPLAPYVASKRAGQSISLTEVLDAWYTIRDQHDFYLIEGAGGLAVPLGEHFLVADLAKEIGYPLLIVARPNLGTINHTLLTVHYARSIGLDVLGVIINGLRTPAGVAEQTNPSLIEQFADVPVLAVLPWIEHPTPEEMIRVAEKHIDIKKIYNT